MKDLEQIKCPKCGFMNLKLTKKCTKCKQSLDDMTKSCPKCGKIKKKDTIRCDCGFNFNKKRRSLLGNIIIAVIIMVLLFVVLKINDGILEEFNFGLKVILIFAVVVMFIKTIFNFGDDVVSYSAETEIVENSKSLSKMKKISNIAIIVGGIAVAIFLICYYCFR